MNQLYVWIIQSDDSGLSSIAIIKRSCHKVVDQIASAVCHCYKNSCSVITLEKCYESLVQELNNMKVSYFIESVA